MRRLDLLFQARRQLPGHSRELVVGLKVSAWLVVLFHGDPDLVSALVSLIGRIAT